MSARNILEVGPVSYRVNFSLFVYSSFTFIFRVSNQNIASNFKSTFQTRPCTLIIFQQQRFAFLLIIINASFPQGKLYKKHNWFLPMNYRDSFPWKGSWYPWLAIKETSWATCHLASDCYWHLRRGALTGPRWTLSLFTCSVPVRRAIDRARPRPRPAPPHPLTTD